MNESPVFIAQFADNQTTRMTTFLSGKTLDVERGVRLARHAYRSRMKKEPPTMVTARFERDGKVLETYNAIDLEDIDNDSIGDDRAVERIQEQESDDETVERIQDNSMPKLEQDEEEPPL